MRVLVGHSVHVPHPRQGNSTNLLPAAGTILDRMAVLERYLLVEDGGAAVVAVRVEGNALENGGDPGPDGDIPTTEPGGVAAGGGDGDRPRVTRVGRVGYLLFLGRRCVRRRMRHYGIPACSNRHEGSRYKQMTAFCRMSISDITDGDSVGMLRSGIAVDAFVSYRNQGEWKTLKENQNVKVGEE